jgi:hypothetical protein
MPYFVPRTDAKVKARDDKGNREGRPIREKMKGIEKDLHNASKGGLLIKNLASNNTKYYRAKGMHTPPPPPSLCLITSTVIILLQRQRVGLFSGRENVDSRLSVDEYSAVEEKQSPGLKTESVCSHCGEAK